MNLAQLTLSGIVLVQLVAIAMLSGRIQVLENKTNRQRAAIRALRSRLREEES